MSYASRTLGIVGLASVLGLLTMVGAVADESLAKAAANTPGAKLSLALPNGRAAHIAPTIDLHAQIQKQLQGPVGLSSSTPVTYHGGKIMPSVSIYAIFWTPPALQTGALTSMPVPYRTVVTNMLKNYAGHSIANINTQYYQQVGAVKTYHSGLGALAGSYIDTSPYPASDCTDAATPGNCISDINIVNEIEKVRALKLWTPGINKIFMVFTTAGEGSCFGTSCSYTHFCAYHSWYGTAAAPIIYSNEPYGDNVNCQSTALLPNAGTADSAVTAARHEISEATTDPLLDAWWDPITGEETSDKCNFNYGTRTWDKVGANFLATHFWGGNFFLMQQEYSLHSLGCKQEGP